VTARLALVGAPGAGKSEVAAELARRWECPLVDTDAEYERVHGRTVADAVVDDEASFRIAEREIVLAALERPGVVVAVGGGAPADSEVAVALRTVRVVWLEVGLVDAARRTGLSGARPLSLGNVRGQLHEMLKSRASMYASVADLRVGTDGRGVGDVADEIAKWENT
jgi:shikimate kinase